jgi:competence protein ComEA
MFRLTKQEQVIIGVLALVATGTLVGSTVLRGPHERGHEVELPLNTTLDANVVKKETQVGSKETLVVHVTGQVARPGTYELPLGARVEDAVTKAGPTSLADIEALNLAAKLRDGQKIVVPAYGEPADVSSGGGTASGGPEADRVVDLNTATQAELETLPSIGPIRAKEIIRYRQERPFRRVEDLMNVPGIGPGTFEKLKDRIAVQ